MKVLVEGGRGCVCAPLIPAPVWSIQTLGDLGQPSVTRVQQAQFGMGYDWTGRSGSVPPRILMDPGSCPALVPHGERTYLKGISGVGFSQEGTLSTSSPSGDA